MKKMLSIILALSMFASVMVGFTLTVGAGYDDEALALYDFTVDGSGYVPTNNGQMVDATPYVGGLGFNAYKSTSDATLDGEAVLTYFQYYNNRTPQPVGLAFSANRNIKGRVTMTYAIPAVGDDVETMVYEFAIRGQNDMRASAFGMSIADAQTIANEMTNTTIVSPTSNGASVASDTYESPNRLLLTRFGTGGDGAKLYSFGNANVGTIKGKVGSSAAAGSNGYDVRIEYTPAESKMHIEMIAYNNSDVAGEKQTADITVTPNANQVWPTHLFWQTVHNLSGSDKGQSLKYLKVYDKKLENQASVTDVEISADVMGVEKGGNLQLKAKVLSGSIEQTGAEVEWGLEEAPEGISISDAGVLSVAENANINYGDYIRVLAKNADVTGYKDIEVLGPKTIVIDGNIAIAKNSTDVLTSKVFADNNLELKVLTDVIWSVDTPDTGVVIDKTGTIYVPADTDAEEITVRATSKYTKAATGTYTMRIVPEDAPLYAEVDFEDTTALPDAFKAENITQVQGRDGNVYQIGAGSTQTGGVTLLLDRYATGNTMAKASFDYMTENFPESASMFTVRDHNENANPMNVGSLIFSNHSSIVEKEYEDPTTGVFKIAGLSGMKTGEWYHFDVYAYPSADKNGRGVFFEITGIFDGSEEVQTKTAVVYGRKDSNAHYAKIVKIEFGTGYASGNAERGDNKMYLDNISVSALKPSVDVEIKGVAAKLGGSVKATSAAAGITNLTLSKGNNSVPFDFVRGIDLQLTVNETFKAIVTNDDDETILEPSTTTLLRADDTKFTSKANYKYTVEFIPSTNYGISSVDSEDDIITAVNVSCLIATEESARVFVAAYDGDGSCIEVVSGAIEGVNVGEEANITLSKGLNTENAQTVKAFIMADGSLAPLAGVPYDCFANSEETFDENDYTIFANYKKTYGIFEEEKILNTSQGGFLANLNSYWLPSFYDKAAEDGIKWVRLYLAESNYDMVSRNEETQKLEFDFTKLDKILLPLLEKGMKPLICAMGFDELPEEFSDEQGRPTNMVELGEYFTAVAQHYVDLGYTGWIWESHNEPEMNSYLGSPDKIVTHYKVLAEAIKKVDPTALVGGYGMRNASTNKDTGFKNTFIDFIKNNPDVACDFVSLHQYSLTDFSCADSIDSWMIERGLEKPIIQQYTEWGYDWDISRPGSAKDISLVAAYGARRMLSALPKNNIERIYYYSLTDGLEAEKLLNGDAGLYTIDGHRKSMSYLFNFYHNLGNIILSKDIASNTNKQQYGLVTKDSKDGSVSMLLYNYSEDPSEISICLDKLPFKGKNVKITKRIVDENNGNYAKDYMAGFRGYSVTEHELPFESIEVIEGNSTYMENIPMSANSIMYIKLEKTTDSISPAKITQRDLPVVNVAAGRTVTTRTSSEEDNWMGESWSRNYLTDSLQYSFESNNWGRYRLGYRSRANSTENNNEWITIDLGAKRNINKVNLIPVNYTAQDGLGFPVDFKLRVSEDNKTWKDVVVKTNYNNGEPVLGVQEFEFDIAYARYVQLNVSKLSKDVNGDYRLQLAEIQVESAIDNAVNNINYINDETDISVH